MKQSAVEIPFLLDIAIELKRDSLKRLNSNCQSLNCLKVTLVYRGWSHKKLRNLILPKQL